MAKKRFRREWLYDVSCQEHLLPISEVAEVLGVSEKTVKRWTNSGKLKCRRTEGNHRRFLVSDLKTFLIEQALGPVREDLSQADRELIDRYLREIDVLRQKPCPFLQNQEDLS